jgi:hypothetical protein
MKMTVFWDVTPRNLVDTDHVSEVLTVMMEAVSTSEESVNIY